MRAADTTFNAKEGTLYSKLLIDKEIVLVFIEMVMGELTPLRATTLAYL